MPESTVRLGLMPPLTGLVEMYGTEIIRAGKIACDEVNESGGILGQPLELVIEDDGSLPESSVAAANKLVEQHRCVAIIGNLLSNSRIAVAYQVAEPRRIPYLNFSFYEGSILSHYFFHFAALPNQQIERMIPYMLNHFGPRMFFAGNNYEWPRGSIDAAKRVLEQSGGQVVGEEYCPIGVGDDDIEHLLDQVAESRADVFVPYFAGADQVHLLTRFTERGLKKQMAVVMGHYDEAMASRLPPEVREGFYSSNTYFMTLDTQENKEYLKRLSNQPGVKGIWPQGDGILTNFGEGTYLCVKAFAKAANQAGSLDPEALINALETIEVSGPQGIVKMDPVTHHAQVNTYLSCCRADGSFAIVERFGAIAPRLPERYRHLRISKQSGQEDIYLQSRMMEQITEAVLLVHAIDGNIVYTNPGAERMFGYGPSELIREHFSVLFAPTGKSSAEITASIGEILSKKGVWLGETENITKDGKHFWCAASISVFTHPQYGEVWIILNKDITELKCANEELISSHNLLKNVVENAPVRIFWKDTELRYLGCNTAFAHDAGMSYPENVVGKDDSHMAWREQAELYRADDKRVMDSDTPILGYEEPQTTPDGHRIWLRTSKVPMHDGSGSVIGMIGIYDDITERKEAEEKLHRANRALKTLSAGNMALVQATTEAELLQMVTSVIVEQGGYLLAVVDYADDNLEKSITPMAWEKSATSMAWSGAEESQYWARHLSWADTEQGQLPVAKAIRNGTTQTCHDITSDPGFAPWKDAALAHGYVSNVALPLVGGGRVFGGLSIYSSESDAFDEEEIRLLEELAHDLAYGIISLRTRAEHEQHTVILRQSLEQFVQAIAGTLEARDPYTAGHQRRVAELAKAIAQEMGLPEDQVDGIHLAATIHDLGKAHIPTEILSRPGRLTDLEYMLIKTHPQAGYDILKDVKFPWPIADIILQHHEMLDGSGYPRGLKEDQILIEAKIITVADVVEAISSHRPYRPSLGIDAALEEIERSRGVKYDPQVVDACLKLFRELNYKLPN